MNIPVINNQGERTGEYEVPGSIWSQDRSTACEFASILRARAGNRRGTASTRTRAECRGGGKKPWRQKGTGRARHGSRRSPIWKGGGVTFGPKPRSFSFSLNKKVRRNALFSALSSMVGNDTTQIIEGVVLDEMKLKAALKAVGVNNLSAKTMVVYDLESNGDLMTALANSSEYSARPYTMLSTEEILHCNKLLFTKEAVERMKEIWA